MKDTITAFKQWLHNLFLEDFKVYTKLVLVVYEVNSPI